MPPERTTLSAQVDSDTELAQQFEQYREQNGMTSKSEAVRHLVRSGLKHELQQLDDTDDADSAQSRSTAADADSEPNISVDFIRGNEPIIVGVAFIVGANGILESMTSVAGESGAWMFVIMGVLVAAWIFVDAIQNWRSDEVQTADQARASAGGAD